jgi:S1-C subfamily serine protease
VGYFSSRSASPTAIEAAESTAQPSTRKKQQKIAESKTSPPVAADRERVELEHAMELARLHQQHSDHEAAEKVLTDALAKLTTANADAARSLLVEVRTARDISHPAGEPAQSSTDASSKPSTTVVRNDEVSPPAAAEPVPSEPPPDNAPTERDVKPRIVDLPDESQDIEKRAATDEELADLIQTARNCFEAKAALAKFDDFLSRHTISDEQGERFDPRYDEWQQRATDSLVRNGSRWISKAENESLQKETDLLIEQAIELIRASSYEQAVSMLQKASNTDQNGIRADFALGLAHILASPLPVQAEKHFRIVLARSPGHVAALNNLALAEVKLQKYSTAIQHWTLAIDAAPSVPAIGQNLGRFTKEAASGKLAVSEGLKSRVGELYSELVASGKSQPADYNTGWLLMPLVVPEREKGRQKREHHGQLVAVGNGTGFAIGDGYIVTNRHVVNHDEYGTFDKLTVVDPGDPEHNRELDADIVAVSDDHDLALIRCPQLNAVAIPLRAEVPRRGTSVMALGYPLTTQFGFGLKATVGIVTGLPDPHYDNMLLMDLTANPGNSGGPICDNSGCVVAVTTMKYFDGYSGGVLASDVIRFLSAAAPDLKPRVQENAEDLDWPDVDERVSPSTVMILAHLSTSKMGFDLQVAADQRYLEDRSCSVCTGRGIIACPADGCVSGAVSRKERVLRDVNPQNGAKFYTTRFVKVRCGKCSGKGAVDCPHCSRGVDPSLVR